MEGGFSLNSLLQKIGRENKFSADFRCRGTNGRPASKHPYEKEGNARFLWILFFIVRFRFGDGGFFLLIGNHGQCDRGNGSNECRDGNDQGDGALVEDRADNGGVFEFCVILVGEGGIAEIAIDKADVCFVRREAERSGIAQSAIYDVLTGVVVVKGAFFNDLRNGGGG